MVAQPGEPAKSVPERDRMSFLDHLSGRGLVLLVIPAAVTVALAVAVFAGGLAIGWFVLGAIVVGPLVVLSLLAFDLGHAVARREGGRSRPL